MLRRIGFWALVSVLLGWSLFPLWYAFVTSFSTDTQLFVPHYVPPALDWLNYADLLHRSRILRGMLNSLAVACGVLALTLTLGLMAAHPLARTAFPLRRPVLYAVLATSMFPQVAVLAGMYELVRTLGLYNTLTSVVLADLLFLLPFTVWLLTAYLRALPREVEDMAQIDGARPWTLLVRIYLPLMAPGLAATALLSFIAVWNEFLFAFTFTLTEEKRTAPVAMALLGGQTPHDLPWGSLMAASVILTLPMLALVAVFQRHIASGLTAGMVNG